MCTILGRANDLFVRPRAYLKPSRRGFHTLERTLGVGSHLETLAELEPIAGEVSRLADQILNLLETHVKNRKFKRQ